MKIHFITSNKGKIKSLNSYFQNLGRPDVEIIPTNLNLIEPQADTVAEVSLFKARQAFQQLKEPVLVEDGGFAIEALNGFPGVYTKYANQTLMTLESHKNQTKYCKNLIADLEKHQAQPRSLRKTKPEW